MFALIFISSLTLLALMFMTPFIVALIWSTKCSSKRYLLGMVSLLIKLESNVKSKGFHSDLACVSPLVWSGWIRISPLSSSLGGVARTGEDHISYPTYTNFLIAAFSLSILPFCEGIFFASPLGGLPSFHRQMWMNDLTSLEFSFMNMSIVVLVRLSDAFMHFKFLNSIHFCTPASAFL